MEAQQVVEKVVEQEAGCQWEEAETEREWRRQVLVEGVLVDEMKCGVEVEVKDW